jgi:hypothetical protein
MSFEQMALKQICLVKNLLEQMPLEQVSLEQMTVEQISLEQQFKNKWGKSHYILIILNRANVRIKMILELVLFRENVVAPFLFTNSFFQNKTQPWKRFGWCIKNHSFSLEAAYTLKLLEQ